MCSIEDCDMCYTQEFYDYEDEVFINMYYTFMGNNNIDL